MRKLILYATPVGDLARACDRYFAAVAPTTAQDYPPHITLTGFFTRSSERAATIIERAQATLDEAGAVPDDEVTVARLGLRPDWVGLEIESPWLIELAARFAAADSPGPDEDAIRLKTWLHLSLAYGVNDLSEHNNLARAEIDPAAPVQWDAALWERSPTNTWQKLTT